MIRFCILLTILIASISALPTFIYKANSDRMTTLEKRVSYYNDAGSVLASTAIDTTQTAMKGFDTASKLGTSAGTSLLGAVVDTATKSLVPSAGGGSPGVLAGLPIGPPPAGRL